MDTPDGRGTVVEVDLLRQRVKVRLEDQPETIVTHPNEEIAVLRSGKAKKTDAPIPADLAPISGRRPKQEEDREQRLTLEPVRIRSKEEPEESPEPAEEEVAAQQENKPAHRKNRRNRGQRKENKQDAPQQEPQAAEPAAGEKKRNNRHRRYRHRPRSNSENKSAE